MRSCDKGVESHDSRLKLLAHGDYLIAMDDKPIAEVAPKMV
jgi:hypothetical protein